jgi:pimeloyl-ACP methyl ester carboxylesterase
MHEPRLDDASHGWANLDDITLHYVEADERGNPLVILLHGFPEFWYAWRQRDRALGIELTKGLGQWVSDVRIERLPEASHWVQNDAPQQVNDLLLDFLLEAA